MMRFFLDMNIPVYFCLQTGHHLEDNAKKFVNNKSSNQFLLCDYIKSLNLPKWLKRQRSILFEFNQKIQDPNYVLFSSQQAIELFPKDKLIVEKFLTSYKNTSQKDMFAEKINEIFNLLPLKVGAFIQKYIDEIVVPVETIDPDLRSCLLDILTPNDSDAKTVASAIQEHKNKELAIVTADKKDINLPLLEYVHTNFNLKKRYPSLPEIKYLQDL